MDLQPGDRFRQLLVETCKEEKRITRPRVRPVSHLPSNIRIEFPRSLREDFPIGSRFICDVVVAQKHYEDGNPKGDVYLVANRNSIIFHSSPNAKPAIWAILKPDSVSGRAYEYQFEPELIKEVESQFQQLRLKLLDRPLQSTNNEQQGVIIDKMIREYALLRSQGTCEACDLPIPFFSKNEKPYLQVHFNQYQSEGAKTIPANISALCPNCYQKAKHLPDSSRFSNQIRLKISQLESSFNLKV